MIRTSISTFLLALAFTFSVFAQSQALNGQIEGTVADANGAVVPNAVVTAKNTDNGTERKVSANESGFYRIPLLPLGAYQVTVEVAGFKKFLQNGITLSVGQTATINVSLQTGGATETVTIEANSPIADTG